KDRATQYKCGAEFLPSPLASTPDFALLVEPTLVRKGHVTAVAVAVEMEHAVAFLGTATGEVLKVHLSAHPEVYGRTVVTGNKVNKDLLFDHSLEHLYITTEHKITKVAVQACDLKTDCHSCVAMKDPYCGWCVLEGRCTRKRQCARSSESNTWLWSPDQRCVQIKSFDPPSISCKKTDLVQIDIPALPRLGDRDQLHCVFGKFTSTVAMAHGMVTCISCVTSKWGCQWNAQDYSCSDRNDALGGAHIVKPQQSDRCPQFQSPEPLLIPVGHRIPISFQGTNLDIYKGRQFVIGTELMKQTEEEVTQD
ncbi:hypothetical protein CRUP_015248, partial [Coryphaenoides rupestris]